jgi:transcription elongation GreA/GreB family factor
MSKAFTREDDAGQQGDLLPERAIPPHPNLVTADGLAQIEDAITHLTKRQHQFRAGGETVATASTGRDVRYWSARLASAQLTETPRGSQVQFGSRVTIRRPDGSTRIYRIVGIDEADLKVGDAVAVGASEEEIIDIVLRRTCAAATGASLQSERRHS